MCVQKQTTLYNVQITGYQYEEQLLFWELQIARTHQSSARLDRLNGSCTIFLRCETSVCSCIAGKGTTITAILLYQNTLTSQRSEKSHKATFLYLILIKSGGWTAWSPHQISNLLACSWRYVQSFGFPSHFWHSSSSTLKADLWLWTTPPLCFQRVHHGYPSSVLCHNHSWLSPPTTNCSSTAETICSPRHIQLHIHM